MQRCLQSITRFFPALNSIPRSQSLYLEATGLLGLSLYAFAYTFSKDICYIGEWMMVGAFLLSLPKAWRFLKRDPLFIASLFLIVYLFIKAVFTILYYNDPIIETLDAAREQLRFSWILIVAWWVGGTENSLIKVFGFVALGFIITVASGFELSYINNILNSKRIDFGINAQHFSLYAASVLLGFIALAPYFLDKGYTKKKLILWISCLFILGELIIISQTRTIWLGFIFSIILIYFLWIIRIIKNNLNFNSLYKIIISFIIFTAIFYSFIFVNKNVIVDRFLEEKETINNISSGNLEDIELTSLGRRLHIWHWSLEKISTKPLFGWKIDNTSKSLLHKSDNLPDILQKYSHVENSYLEVILNHGLLGFLLFLFFPLYVLASVIASYNNTNISFRFFALFFGLSFLFLLANMCDAYITSWIFWPYLSLLFGSYYSLHFWNDLFNKS